MNILVWADGMGKTTLLNVLSAYIPEDERIVTIEDPAELQLQQPHIVALETRPANIEGRGAITQRELVVNALRMRPDRIIVGEVRADEAIDMLQAMNATTAVSRRSSHKTATRSKASKPGFNVRLNADKAMLIRSHRRSTGRQASAS